MKIKITFKHLDHTEALDQKITEKTNKLKKFFDGNVDVHWTCYVQDGKQFADILLFGSNFEYKARASSDSLYKALDMAIKKIVTQVEKRKSKWKDHMHHKHDEQLKHLIQDNTVLVKVDEDEFYYEESA